MEARSVFFIRGIITCSIAAAFLISVPAASAQPDPAQQAAAQAQQDTMTALQAAQQANEQMMRDAQQAHQQAVQAAQLAAMDRPTAGPRHPGSGRADKPTFSPRPGTFLKPVSVSINAPTMPKAEIFYTLDGSEPTTASTRYTGPVALASSAKLRAIARSPIYSPGREAKGKYVIR